MFWLILFLTGNTSLSRLPLQKPIYAAFISYRVAEMRYNGLTAVKLNVYWDAKCLPVGKNWEDEFEKGLVGSAIFIPILSKERINNSSNAKHNFSLLRDDYPCDNGLHEHRLALELERRGMISHIVPVFIGRGNSYIFATDHPFSQQSSQVIVASVENKVREHFISNGLGSAYYDPTSPSDILLKICDSQGIFHEGEMNVSKIVDVVIKIHKGGNLDSTSTSSI